MMLSCDFTPSTQALHANVEKWVPSVVISGRRTPSTERNELISTMGMPRCDDSSAIAALTAAILLAKPRSNERDNGFLAWPKPPQQKHEIVVDRTDWRVIQNQIIESA
jgi:hypothetical protein